MGRRTVKSLFDGRFGCRNGSSHFFFGVFASGSEVHNAVRTPHVHSHDHRHSINTARYVSDARAPVEHVDVQTSKVYERLSSYRNIAMHIHHCWRTTAALQHCHDMVSQHACTRYTRTAPASSGRYLIFSLRTRERTTSLVEATSKVSLSSRVTMRGRTGISVHPFALNALPNQ